MITVETAAAAGNTGGELGKQGGFGKVKMIPPRIRYTRAGLVCLFPASKTMV